MKPFHLAEAVALLLCLGGLVLSACGGGSTQEEQKVGNPWSAHHRSPWSGPYPPWSGHDSKARPINPTPTNGSGEPSYEFEPEDIERAEEAPLSVREYCAGAVSEAQEVGCLSHVELGEVP